jgi:hypothetical protein
LGVKSLTHTYSSGNVDIDAVALGIVKVFPALEALSNASHWICTGCWLQDSRSRAQSWPTGFRHPLKSSVVSSTVGLVCFRIGWNHDLLFRLSAESL